MSSFEFMPWLTILNLSETRIEALPESICKLTSLEVLIIQDCVLLALLPSEEGSLRDDLRFLIPKELSFLN